MNKLYAAIFAFTLSTVLAGHANANQLTELRPLDFGVFAVTPAGGARTIVVAPTGGTTTPDGGIIKLRDGKSAIFKITQFDPSVLFYITINPANLAHTDGTPSFTFDSFTFDPTNDLNNTIHTNGGAELTINVGATLHIPPSAPSTPGAYRGTFTFLINY